jgi:hypothetical protein
MENGYLVDDKNQLVIKRQNKNIPVQGKFRVDKHNRLSYFLNEPSPWRKEHGLPRILKFNGSWSLTSECDLALTVTKNNNFPKKDILVLKGEVLPVGRDELAFEIKSYDRNGLLRLELLKLSGVWQADEDNRFIFTVKKEKEPDTLILEGKWELNQNQQIAYRYEKINLKTKQKLSRTLIFDGFWQISRRNRIAYALERGTDSSFDFHAQAESPSLYPRDNAIKYRLGAGLAKGAKGKKQVISLFGDWKVNRDLGLEFKMQYGKGRLRSMSFGSEMSLSEKDKVVFALRGERREPLGISVIFRRKLLPCAAQGFLRLKTGKNESAAELGAEIPF